MPTIKTQFPLQDLFPAVHAEVKDFGVPRFLIYTKLPSGSTPPVAPTREVVKLSHYVVPNVHYESLKMYLVSETCAHFRDHWLK